MATDGTDPLPSTPEEYAADIDREENEVVGGREEIRRQGGVDVVIPGRRETPGPESIATAVFGVAQAAK